MSKLTDCTLARKLKESNKCGIITGVIVTLFIISLVVAVILKYRWLKKHFGCLECEMDMMDDDFDLEFDEDGVYTSEADFV